MKKVIKTLALVLSVVMLFTCISVGFGSLTASAAASDVFTTGAGAQQEIESGCYKTTIGSWALEYYKRKVDLTKGFYFTVADASGNMSSQGFLFQFIKDLETKEMCEKNLCVRTTDGGVTMRASFFTTYFANETSIGAAPKTHFVQAVPVKSTVDGAEVTNYVFYIDGKTLNSNGFVIAEADFKNFNNYNEETGAFEGCYLGLHARNHLAYIQLSFPTDDRYTVSVDDNCTYSQSDYLGYDNIDLGFGGRATSTYTVNLLKGVEFGLGKLTVDAQAVDFVRMGFGADIWKIRSDNYEPTAHMAPSFEFANIGGKLAVTTFDGTAETDFVVLDTDIKAKHTVKAVAVTVDEATAYKFSVDGTVLDGIVLSETDFAALNNNGTGAYMGLYANNQDGAAFYEINPLGLVPTDVAFAKGVGPHTFPENNGVYTLTTPSWGSINSTWRADLSKGLKFKVNDVKEWIGINLSGKYSVDTGYRPKIEFKNIGGKLQVVVRYTTDYVMLTDFDVNTEHTIWAKPVTEDGVTVYEFYIDDIRLIGNHSGTRGIFTVSEEEFKAINGYSMATGDFEGAYLCIQSANTASVDLGAAATAPALKYGDVDGNGTIDAEDIAIICKRLLGGDLGEAVFDRTLADANDDGNIDILDLIRLKKELVK